MNKFSNHNLKHRYKKRSIRFIELWECEGWTLKVYGISNKNEFPPLTLINIGKTAIKDYLPGEAFHHGRFGAGFLGIHEGHGSNFFFLGWWENENELYLRVLQSASETPNKISNISSSGPASCVWELQVINFEKDSWICNVLNNANGPNLHNYLNDHLNTEL
jgi:hypothetical protein